MRTHLKGPPQRTRPQSRTFPRIQFTIFLLISLALAYGTLLIILASGNVIPILWFYILGPVIAFIEFIITLYFSMFPSSPTDAPNHISQRQPPASTYTPRQTHDTTSVKDISIWNVPYQHNPFFIGRDDLLTHLYTTLHNEKAAALTQAISGLGGIGKTQLAVEYAYLYRDKYDSILWTTATTYETLFTDFVALAELLDLPEKDSQNQTITVEAVKQWLETHTHWLLILNNANELSLIRSFLPTRGNGHILITTLAQATRTVAQPLKVATTGSRRQRPLPPSAHRNHSIGCLVPQASTSDATSAKKIAALLNGLPLALDQAGAYIEETGCGLPGYLKRYLAEHTTLLRTRGHLDTDHPESVTTTFSLSFTKVQKANPAAADLLRFFSFLSPEAIPIDLCSEGAPDLGKLLKHTATDPQRLDEALSILYSYSLVRRDVTTNTFYIHRLVQAVLKDKMSARTQRQWAERTVRVVNRAFPAVEVETWQRCQQLIPQAIVCMILIDQWHMSFPETAQLLNQAGYYFCEHAQYTEAEPLLQRALAICKKKLGTEHPNTATSLNNLALLYESQGKYEQAEPLYQRALAIREKRLGAEHPHTRTIQANYTRLLQKTKDERKQQS